jgi:hypothetical protein
MPARLLRQFSLNPAKTAAAAGQIPEAKAGLFLLFWQRLLVWQGYLSNQKHNVGLDNGTANWPQRFYRILEH